MSKSLEELTRDEAANAWVDENVPVQIATQLRAWCRMQIEQHDCDDRARIGVFLGKPGLMQAAPDAAVVRAYVYGLIFTWDTEEPQVCCRAYLRANDENKVIGFTPVDHVETLH